MYAEYLIYLASFIASSGVAVIGIITSYQIFKQNKKEMFQLLLYQQIFLFTFFIYSIWGNLALRQVTTDALIAPEISAKLALLLPLLGIPFLTISWFMLLKFSSKLNNYPFAGSWVYIYFSGILLLVSVMMYLFDSGSITTPSSPDNFMARLFISLNLFIHLVFLLPFLKPRSPNKLIYTKQEMHLCLFIYLGGIAVHSGVVWFLGSFGYIYAALSIVLLFATSALLPVCIKYLVSITESKPQTIIKDFAWFCKAYRISKRESEIVLEICAGKTNKAIAEKLFITLQTVKDHTHRIYTKTNVKSRVQLANLVRQKTGQV